MPIRIDNRLPAKHLLELENIFVMAESRANTQDIRPLKILLLNLMPKKIETETQLLRLLSNSPLQIDIELLQMASHTPKNTSSEHMNKFYKTFDEIKDKKFDGMIFTGAPVELMEYEEVDYWNEFCDILDWTNKNVYSCVFICWASQAALYYKYKIPKYTLSKKMFGIFPQKILNSMHPLMRNLDENFFTPHSRNTEIKVEDIEKVPELEILSSSDLSGINIVSDKNCKNFYFTGHGEYDRSTLADEYFRDKNLGIDISIPHNYFPEDNPEKTPLMTWRQSSSILFSNWLNFFVYQKTPYDLNKIK